MLANSHSTKKKKKNVRFIVVMHLHNVHNTLINVYSCSNR